LNGFPGKLCDSLNMKLLGDALVFFLEDTTEQDINMSNRFHLKTGSYEFSFTAFSFVLT
jgi:hypothetical protein